jgi:hypothetical protein
MAIFYNPNRKKGLFYIPSGATGGGAILRIEYSASRFCEDGTDPIPGITGDTGGTFSSTTGLVFISTSTGQVDLSASTPGSYVVTYTAPSSDTATTSISIDSIPVVSAGADVAICTGNSTVLTATGATTYSWSTGQTGASITVDPTTNTTYTVTGFNGACSATDSVDVTVYPLPTVSISGTLTYCVGASTTLDAGAGFASYSWSSGETTQTISATAGNYTVTVTDSNGCSNTSAQVTVSELPLDTATVTYSANAYCQMPTGALAVDGYYPLYTTESAAEAESSDGTAHSHTLSGTTYYMPNDGVIQYHNTYSLTTPAPTITGETGTFSESTGNLSIDSSTGVINVNNSTAGTYTVVYTTNGSCPNTVNNTITINALDGATFAYSSNSLPQTGTASLTTTPTTSGGVFSAYPSGLSINSSTGEIDLAASTIQSYKIFYETSGAGCPNSSTFDLAVTASGISNVYSMNFDSASSDYIKSSLLNSLDGLSQMSISLWIKPSGTSQVAIFLSNPNSLTGSGNFQFAVGLLGNELRFLEGTNSKFFRTTTAPLTYGQWNHVVISYTAPTALIYVNAVAQSTVQNGVPTTLSNADDGLHIGKDRNGFWSVFDGLIDEVAIWNTALTDGTGGTVNQIAEIYNATSTNLTKDLTTVSGSNLIYWNRMGD